MIYVVAVALVAEITIPPWILGLGGLFSVLIVLGGAYAVLRSSVQTKTAQLWKEQAEAFENRVRQVEEENDRCKLDNQATRAENESLKARVKTLEGVVGAGPAIEKLGEELKIWHDEHLDTVKELVDVVNVIVETGVPQRPIPAPRKAPVRKTTKSTRK